MLAQSRDIILGNGVTVSTPLLIPSPSSSALGLLPFEADHGKAPDLTACSVLHSRGLVGAIEESLLISAYDIKYEFLAEPEAFRTNFRHSPYAQPRVLVIDNGWYEKNGIPLGSPFGADMSGPLAWEEHDFISIVDNFDKDIHPLVVNWDYNGAYEEQISRAQSFFGARPHPKGAPMIRGHSLANVSEGKNLQPGENGG